MSEPITQELHYRGDHRKELDTKLVYGPDMFGAHYAPSAAEYDAEYEYEDGGKGRTTIKFRVIPPAEFARDAIRGSDGILRLL